LQKTPKNAPKFKELRFLIRFTVEVLQGMYCGFFHAQEVFADAAGRVFCGVWAVQVNPQPGYRRF
jgi:hypothetical protein